MECKAKLVSVFDNTAVFKILDADANMIPKEDDLKLKISLFKNKRSLNANSYFHVLVGKIAEKLTISKAHCKNIMITKYGQPFLFDDGESMIFKTNAPVEYMQELETMHSIPVKYAEENGKEVVFYKIYRGSHTYDTKEMSCLIDGTVADAKDLDIETMTPAELEKLKRDWSNYEKRISN